MPDIQPLLDQLSALSPAWAFVAGLVAWILRSNGWLRMPGSGADPLSARLQARVADRYKELAAGGQEEEAFYALFSKIVSDPADKEKK